MNDDFNSPSGSSGHTGNPNAGWERATIEKLLFAQLKEQQAARRWRLFSRLLWLGLFGAMAWFLYNAENMNTSVSTPHTAVIDD